MASTARLDELKKKFDENPRRYFAPLANEHRKSGDLDQAISLCRAHLPQQPAHISGHIVLAQALFEAGSVDESHEIFLAALGLDPENLIALRYLGDIAREASDVDTARSWYQRVLEVDPRNDEIVQLVRDLDMPRPVVTPEATIAPDVPIEAVTASAVRPAPTPVANNDARFAPLSIEDFDVGTDAPSESSDAQRDGPAQPAAAAMSFDVPSTRSGDSSAAGQSAPDAEEHDPFDLHPSASAESLFDGGTDTAANDLFLSEMAQVNGSDDGSDLSAPDAQNATFEEGFYLEPAPSAPSDAAASASSEHVASDAETPITASTAPTVRAAPEPADAFVAESTVAHEEPSQEESYTAASMTDPNAEALALFADTQTAEWEPPTSDVASIAHTSSDDALGLEVMEFVPPSREAAPSSIADDTSYADAVPGGTSDLASGEQESVPAAFVTETMAELYLQQGFRNEALAVYRELLSRNPADASLRERVDQIESGSMSSLGMATLSEDVVQSARKRQTGRPARSVRSFFASLASRRAPSPPSQSYVGADATDDAPAEAPASDYALVSEPVTAAESPTTSEPLNAAPAASASERIAPLTSAAEALANYDPFADTAESMTPPVTQAPSPTQAAWPDVTPSQSQSIVPDTSLGNPHTDYPSESTPVEPVAAPDPVSPRSSLQDLFPNGPVTARTEAVAQAFATAFGRDEPQGRPTRAASNELSLDHVFRGSAESAGASDGGFSFDQFFSDARPAGGGDVAAPVVSAPDTGRSAGPSGDAHDIEQFTAWLEGLKKK